MPEGTSPPDEDEGPEPVQDRRVVRLLSRAASLARSRVFRIVFLAVTVVGAGVAIAADYEAFVQAARQLGPLSLLLAFGATLLNILLATQAWRAILADLGSRLGVVSAARVFLVGQLGKYLPGSVWFLLAQMELAAEVGVPRQRSGSASIVNVVLSVATALVTTLVALPFAPSFLPSGFWWVFLLLPVLAAVLYPPFLNRGLNLLLRFARRAPLEHHVSIRGALAAMAWSALSWLSVGVQVYLLVLAVGGEAGLPLFLLCLGGYTLAWAVGFLTLVAPAGAGAREAALLLVLAPVLSPGRALVVVVVSRVLLTLGDLSLAGLSLVGADVQTRSRARAVAREGEAAAGAAPPADGPPAEGPPAEGPPAEGPPAEGSRAEEPRADGREPGGPAR